MYVYILECRHTFEAEKQAEQRIWKKLGIWQGPKGYGAHSRDRSNTCSALTSVQRLHKRAALSPPCRTTTCKSTSMSTFLYDYTPISPMWLYDPVGALQPRSRLENIGKRCSWAVGWAMIAHVGLVGMFVFALLGSSPRGASMMMART